ncbi:hypothetical protein CFC21_046727 [Triticum aestivum]|uniref:DUF4283 domain-containing protein n=2 Tax=Triticum aestivum TaxID=4565 RepID=A0A9R1FV77_WHEAT|nr:hypothetical protein CFC21_046725 [Triticum aestivum]KAF7035952.1 hypothetical protein CFC21_046727 [Triticum aestivum]
MRRTFWWCLLHTSSGTKHWRVAAPFIEHLGIKLFIKPWLRQAGAASRVMRVQVDIMIEGIPSHAWARDTAAELLGSACLIDSLAPQTTSREDLSLFKLRAWCVDPDDVPAFRKLWVPKPPEVSVDPAARRASFRQLLEYPAFIHIGRVRDFSPPELWRRASGSDSRSGQSGLPDSSGGSFQGGEWVVQPWTRGVCDDRGAGRRSHFPANDGGGGAQRRSYRAALEGRVGPSAWRLPHMGSGALAVTPAPVVAHDDRTVREQERSNGLILTQSEMRTALGTAGNRTVPSKGPILENSELPTEVETAAKSVRADQCIPEMERTFALMHMVDQETGADPDRMRGWSGPRLSRCWFRRWRPGTGPQMRTRRLEALRGQLGRGHHR